MYWKMPSKRKQFVMPNNRFCDKIYHYPIIARWNGGSSLLKEKIFTLIKNKVMKFRVNLLRLRITHEFWRLYQVEKKKDLENPLASSLELDNCVKSNNKRAYCVSNFLDAVSRSSCVHHATHFETSLQLCLGLHSSLQVLFVWLIDEEDKDPCHLHPK